MLVSHPSYCGITYEEPHFSRNAEYGIFYDVLSEPESGASLQISP